MEKSEAGLSIEEGLEGFKNIKLLTNECGDGFLAGSTGTGGCTIP